MNVSGISSTGILEGADAQFGQAVISFSSAQSVNDTLTLSTHGLKSGIYYITMSATVSPGGEIYSEILKLVVLGSDNFSSI